MPNVSLVKGVATNLYTASGIAAGTKLNIQNHSCDCLRLATSQAALLTDCRLVKVLDVATNLASDPGAWAVSTINDGVINVRSDV